MERPQHSLRIGQLASATGVSVETIRFYEREGLLMEPPRRASGYRQYPPDSVRRVHFIRSAKALGFTLAEVGELLTLRVDADKTCGEVREMARHKIRDIEAKVAELGRMKAALQNLERSCRGRGPTASCPILDALDDEAPGAKAGGRAR